MAIIYLGIGGNLGQRQRFLAHTRNWIELRVGPIRGTSSIYETAAWGMEDAPDFLNQVLEVETNLDPLKVLYACNQIERLMGRRRSAGSGYASRTADIDLLHYTGIEMSTSQLTLPHPEIAKRKFVLIPFVELAGDLLLPSMPFTLAQLLERTEDTTEVKKWDSLTAT